MLNQNYRKIETNKEAKNNPMREMQESFVTLSEAIENLQRQGFTEDFNLCDAGIENKSKKLYMQAKS